MDKTLQKVTKDKDQKRVDAGCKGRGNFMKKMKENTLNDAKGGGDTTNSSNKTTTHTTGATNNSSNETTSATNTATTRPNDTYVYGVGILAVLAIGVCVFFTYNASKAKNKKTVTEKQDQPPKSRHMF